MKNNLLKRPGTLVILGIIITILSCNKKPENIGLDLLEGEKLIIGTDSLNFIRAYSYREDSVITSLSTKPYSLLGSFYDPVFGITTSSIYSQLRILTSSYDTISPDFEIDSIILSLVYAGYYGNIEDEQTIRVYRLLDDLDADSSYYSTDNVEYDLNDWGEIGSLSFYPSPSDSVFMEEDSVYQNAAIRIPLETEPFGEYILNLDAETFSDNDNFLEAFKGIYITSDPAENPDEGSIVYYSLESSRSNITIYYNDSLTLPLYINNYCQHFNNYDHQYDLTTDTYFDQMVNENNTSLGAEKLYVQSMGGVQSNIYFPGLQEWVNDRSIFIHDAKLFLTLDESYSYDPPSVLTLFTYDEDGNLASTPDEYQALYFGGKYNEETNAYFFRISFYIQNLINGGEDYGLNLSISGKTYSANGLVLQGTDPELNSNNLRLELIYSEL